MTDRKDDTKANESGNANRNGSGGGIAIGRMTGGAVAAGERARAENRAERAAREAPAGTGLARVPAEAPRDGGIAVGELTGGAVAAGREARAVDASRDLLTVTPELLKAVTALRAELPLLVRSQDDGVDAVGDELAGLEAEARRTGRTQRGRLVRLRALLSSGATAAGGLASAAAVAEAAGRLLA